MNSEDPLLTGGKVRRDDGTSTTAELVASQDWSPVQLGGGDESASSHSLSLTARNILSST